MWQTVGVHGTYTRIDYLLKRCTFETVEERIENIDSIVKHWKESSDQNYVTMQNLLKSRDYSWALFIGHLVIEKLLKAHYVKNLKVHAIFTHDLLLAYEIHKNGIEISIEEKTTKR